VKVDKNLEKMQSELSKQISSSGQKTNLMLNVMNVKTDRITQLLLNKWNLMSEKLNREFQNLNISICAKSEYVEQSLRYLN
jgi:hypothetical protein